MSAASSPVARSPKPLPTPSAGARKSVVVATNSVTTKDGKTVRARIDPSLPVADVVRQLCLNLKLPQPPTMYALQDDQGQLLTDENLRRHVRDKTHLKLVDSPAAEAQALVTKLSKSHTSLKGNVFNLQKLITQEEFAREFVEKDGLDHLINIIETNHGNTLAYALTALRNLMDYDFGWSTLDPTFIAKVSTILSSPATPINVCRPASSILKKLIEADPRSAPSAVASQSSSTRAFPPPPVGSVWRYGFDVVWAQIGGGRNKTFLEVLVQRLASAESGMAIFSIMLINTLLSHATDPHSEELYNELERLNIRKAVTHLMSENTVEDLTSSILDFQANLVRVAYRRKTTPVDPVTSPKARDALAFIWDAALLDKGTVGDGMILQTTVVNGVERTRSVPSEKWTKLGFGTENVRAEFARVGMLGLECLQAFAAHDPDYFAKVVLEQLNRQPERRCPIAMASNEVVELLTDYWSVFAPGYSTASSYQPLFLSFNRVHYLATRFFLRMWNDSSASRGSSDFTRVASLVRSQIKLANKEENPRKTWHEIERIFLEMPYREVRDRQVRELEMEDEMLSKPAVRNLRAKLHNESYEFVKQQRILCLMQGAWFANGVSLPTSQAARESMGQLRRPSRPWRFYRLDRSQKFLQYVDSTVKVHIKNGLEDLPDRIEVSQITDIVTGTCALPPNIAMPEAHVSPFGNIPTTSPLSFTIMTSQGPLADHVSENAARFADWIDGLNMLRNNQVATKETESFVNTLTEIGLKIKLLDLSGEKVDIPSSLPVSPPPTNTDYYFFDPLSGLA